MVAPNKSGSVLGLVLVAIDSLPSPPSGAAFYKGAKARSGAIGLPRDHPLTRTKRRDLRSKGYGGITIARV